MKKSAKIPNCKGCFFWRLANAKQKFGICTFTPLPIYSWTYENDVCELYQAQPKVMASAKPPPPVKVEEKPINTNQLNFF